MFFCGGVSPLRPVKIFLEISVYLQWLDGSLPPVRIRHKISEVNKEN